MRGTTAIIVKSYEFHLLSNMSLTEHGRLEQDQDRKEHITHVNVAHFTFAGYSTHNNTVNNNIVPDRTFQSPEKKTEKARQFTISVSKQ